MNKTLIALCAALVFGGCATKAETKSVLNFEYTTQGGAEFGLVRAFDDSENTVLQFKNEIPDGIKFMNKDGNELQYKKLGQTAIFPGLQNVVEVINGGAVAKVVSKEELAESKIEEIEALPHSQDELIKENKILKAEVIALKGKIEKLKKSGFSEAKENAVTNTFNFSFNSADFNKHLAKAIALIPDAMNAKKIIITGYTDSEKPTNGNVRISKMRAEVAKKFFVDSFVPVEKIEISNIPSGGFVGNNKTEAGRFLNRRVEIKFFY